MLCPVALGMTLLITRKSLRKADDMTTTRQDPPPASRRNHLATRYSSRIRLTRVYRSITAISRSHHDSDERELADDQKIFGTDWLLRTRRSD